MKRITIDSVKNGFIMREMDETELSVATDIHALTNLVIRGLCIDVPGPVVVVDKKSLEEQLEKLRKLEATAKQ